MTIKQERDQVWLINKRLKYDNELESVLVIVLGNARRNALQSMLVGALDLIQILS